jgi:hypothetical protein
MPTIRRLFLILLKLVGLGLLFVISLSIFIALQLVYELDPQRLLSAQALALDQQGYLYLANGHDQLQKYNRQGQWLVSWGTKEGTHLFSEISALAFDQQGQLYLTETYNQRLFKLDAQLDYLDEWDSFSPAAGAEYGDASSKGKGGKVALSYPNGLAFDPKGQLYVLSSGDCRVVKLTPQGQLLATWQVKVGAQTCQNLSLRGLSLDQQDNLYLADGYHQQIYQFSPSGQFRTSWGSEGSGPGQFEHLRGLVADGQGYLYALDERRIQKFDSSGHFISQWPVQQGANLVDLSGAQLVVVGGESTTQINYYDLNGQRVGGWQPLDFTLWFGLGGAGLITALMLLCFRAARRGTTRPKRVLGSIGISFILLLLPGLVLLLFPIPWNPLTPEPLPAYPGSTPLQLPTPLPEELAYYHCSSGYFSPATFQTYATSATPRQVVNYYRKVLLAKKLPALRELVGSSPASLTDCYPYGNYRYRQPAYTLLVFDPAEASDRQLLEKLFPNFLTGQTVVMLAGDFVYYE